jgi:hypothetical protein
VPLAGRLQIHQLTREACQDQARIADHRQQHLAQGFRLRGFQMVGCGRRGGEPDVAEMREFARQRAHRRAELQLDLARLFDLRGESGLRQQGCGESRILGQ